MEELTHTDSEVRRIKRIGFFLGLLVGSVGWLVTLGIVAVTAGPAHAASRECSETTFTFNHKTGDVTVRAQKVFDPTPIYRFRFAMANDKGWITFDDYPALSVPGHFTSTYTRNIRTLKGGHLWALIAFRGSDACGQGVMFGGVA